MGEPLGLGDPPRSWPVFPLPTPLGVRGDSGFEVPLPVPGASLRSPGRGAGGLETVSPSLEWGDFQARAVPPPPQTGVSPRAGLWLLSDGGIQSARGVGVTGSRCRKSRPPRPLFFNVQPRLRLPAQRVRPRDSGTGKGPSSSSSSPYLSPLGGLLLTGRLNRRYVHALDPPLLETNPDNCT